MEYNLKDKIQITQEFLINLEQKSWNEIEYLQNQIANIEVNDGSNKIIQLLKNLLTSYYVFAGSLENLNDTSIITQIKSDVVEPKQFEPIKLEMDDTLADDFVTVEDTTKQDISNIEPFEYFVDFDEPVGDPLTDDDLYNN